MSEKQQVLFEISLENGEFKVAAKESQEGLSGISEETKKGTASFGKFKIAAVAVAAAVGGVVVALGKMISNQLKVIDNEAKLADKLGITTEALSELKHIAGLTGTSVEGLGSAIQQLEVRMGRAEEGSKKASDAIAALGLNFEEIKNLEPEQAFYTLAESLSEVEDRTQQAYLATELFGLQGKELLGVIRSSGSGLKSMAEEARGFGLAISRGAAAEVEKFNDTMFKVSQRNEALKRQFTVGLMPALNDLGRALFSASENGGFLQKALDGIKSATESAIRGITALIEEINILTGNASEIEKINSEMREVYRQFEKLNSLKGKGGGAISEFFGGPSWEEAMKGLITQMAILEKKRDDLLAEEKLSGKPSGGAPAGSGGGGAPPGEPPKADIVKYYQDIGNLRQAHIEKLKQQESEAAVNAQLMLKEKLVSEKEYQAALLAIREETRQQEVIAEATAWQEKAAGAERYYRARLGMESAVWQGTASIAQAGASLMNEKNKALFMVGKVSALTNIAMNTAEGITAGYKWGPFIGSANAAMLGVLGAVQAKNILKQKPPEPAKLKNPEIEIPTLPSFAAGAWSVPRDMVANIHKDEMIMPKPFAEDYRNRAAGGGGMTIIVQGNVVDTEGIFQVVHAAQKDIQKRTGTDVYSRPSVYGR